MKSFVTLFATLNCILNPAPLTAFKHGYLEIRPILSNPFWVLSFFCSAYIREHLNTVKDRIQDVCHACPLIKLSIIVKVLIPGIQWNCLREREREREREGSSLHMFLLSSVCKYNQKIYLLIPSPFQMCKVLNKQICHETS